MQRSKDVNDEKQGSMNERVWIHSNRSRHCVEAEMKRELETY